MKHYDSKYYSLSFTIVVIVSMFIGICLSMLYSKSVKPYFVKQALSTSLNNLKNYSFDFNNKNLLSTTVKLDNYPKGSVPVKFLLGRKITKLEKPYVSRLDLSLLAIEHKNI